MENLQAVLDEVHTIICLMSPEFYFQQIEEVFNDVMRLFKGIYPGYRACNTGYHDLKHTTDSFLAMARLIHGGHINGEIFTDRGVSLALISALMHDTGYIQSEDDLTGTGGKYTLVHIDRSIEFMRKYFTGKWYTTEEFQFCSCCLKCTGLDVEIGEVPFVSKENEILGKMLGTADLLGQMADRTYLEKLFHLFREFDEGGVPGFRSELELIEKTPGFHELTKERFSAELSGVNRHMRAHFRVRWDMDEDFYASAIERHIDYLKFIVEHQRGDYRAFLRRGSGDERLLEKEMQTMKEGEWRSL
jgi:hypothetical protein